MDIPKVPKGMERQWVKCKKCGEVSYYDYIPYGLANPIMVLPCNHGLTERFENIVTNIDTEEALRLILKEK